MTHRHSDSDQDNDSEASNVLITRNTGSAPSTAEPTAPRRASALEMSLRKHTEDVLQQARKISGLATDTWGTKRTESSNNLPSGSVDLEDEAGASASLTQLLSPSNHVFIGLWHRTKSVLGAWPLCLSASISTRGLSQGVKVGVGSFDLSSGVVRFVQVSSQDGIDGHQKVDDKPDAIRAFIECVDHYGFEENTDESMGENGVSFSRAG